jgi:hypothetical protein
LTWAAQNNVKHDALSFSDWIADNGRAHVPAPAPAPIHVIIEDINPFDDDNLWADAIRQNKYDDAEVENAMWRYC